MGKQAVNKIKVLDEKFDSLDPETPQMIAFQEKLNEVITAINDLRSVVSKITSVKE